MSKKPGWQASYYVKDSSLGVSSTECHVTPLLGILLRISQCIGITPVRLRRSRGNTLLEMSHALVVIQRLIMILSSITLITGVGYDFKSKNRMRVGTTSFTAVLWITEGCLLISICLIRVITAPGTVDRLVTLLKQINKINHGLNHGASMVRCPKYDKFKLFSYIIGIVLLHIYSQVWCCFNYNDHLVVTLYACVYYLHLSVTLIQMEMGLVMAEINTLNTKLNNHLERLLQSISQNSDDVVNSKYGYLTIRQLAQYHEQIYEMVKVLNEDSGPIMLLCFMLTFLHLLITPYNLMCGIVLQQTAYSIILQSFWSISHFVSLLVMVEPCQWMQDQMDLTRYLLSRLARRSAYCDERFFNQIDLFILQVQTKGALIAPMGVFAVTRSLVASIIGGVSTYLAIIIQMHNVCDTDFI